MDRREWSDRAMTKIAIATIPILKSGNQAPKSNGEKLLAAREKETPFKSHVSRNTVV